MCLMGSILLKPLRQNEGSLIRWNVLSQFDKIPDDLGQL
jgi:hypothetical protein